MKKLLSAVAVVAMLTACNGKTNSSTVSTSVNPADTVGLKEFQEAKARQEMIQTEGIYNNNGVNSGTATNQTPDNSSVATSETKTTTTSTTPHHHRTVYHSGHGSTTSASGGRYEDSRAVTTEKTKVKKKGWSSAAKDAAIGAGVGAVGGAIISKDKSKGAIIGGVLGAGGGYILGRHKDKKTGRY